MRGTITIDVTENGDLILNARRNNPYAHRHLKLDKGEKGDLLAFVTHYREAISDERLKWKVG